MSKYSSKYYNNSFLLPQMCHPHFRSCFANCSANLQELSPLMRPPPSVVVSWTEASSGPSKYYSDAGRFFVVPVGASYPRRSTCQGGALRSQADAIPSEVRATSAWHPRQALDPAAGAARRSRTQVNSLVRSPVLGVNPRVPLFYHPMH